MEIRAIVMPNGDVYYHGEDITEALKAESKSPLLHDNNLIVFVKRFIHKLSKED